MTDLLNSAGTLLALAYGWLIVLGVVGLTAYYGGKAALSKLEDWWSHR